MKSTKIYTLVILTAICLSLLSDIKALATNKVSKATGAWYAYVTGTVTPPSGWGTAINPPVCVSNPNTPIINKYVECGVTVPMPICCYYVEQGFNCPGFTPPWYVVTEITYGEYGPL